MIETYDEAVAYLDSHIGQGIRPGLSRTAEVLDMMGNPHRDYPVVLVTGSNGKTSTTRMISAMLTAHGLRVGTFTSPHLERIEERFGMDNDPAAADDFVQAVADVAVFADLYKARTGDSLTYFEVTTVLAYAFFAAQAVDVAVVEVGMGGRLDATNVADADVAVITGISLEHTDVLGETFGEIASEKVGITRPGAVLIEGPLPAEARAVVVAHCSDKDVRRVTFGIDLNIGEFAPAVGGWLVTIEGAFASYPDLFLPVHGEHQLTNLTVAIGAVEAFFERALVIDAVEEGLAGLTVPGRLETVSVEPLIVIDGAHNPEGMEAAAAALDAFGPRDWVVIFGAMGDKDVASMVVPLGSFASHVITTAVDHERAADPVVLADLVRAAIDCPVDSTSSTAEALDLARQQTGEYGAILVLGSLYLAGEIRSRLG
ncbi:MAG: bifunctional folylpolyglutamate synthase/dihydrofolate synthase [Acidimicrobiia bacterium]|nr:bifunctional folylpolyglutamate synthase/dihydrofolate synthase [Acidimicrobiia bacterium]